MEIYRDGSKVSEQVLEDSANPIGSFIKHRLMGLEEVTFDSSVLVLLEQFREIRLVRYRQHVQVQSVDELCDQGLTYQRRNSFLRRGRVLHSHADLFDERLFICLASDNDFFTRLIDSTVAVTVS